MREIELSKVCYLINKGKHVIKDNTGNVYMVGFTNIENNKINLKEASKCHLSNEYMDLKIYNIENNDILLPPITRKNLIIKQLESQDNPYNMIYSSRAVYIRVNSNIYLPEFLYYVLSTEKYKKKLLKEVYTAGSYVDTYQISIERLKKFKVPNISISMQYDILEKTKELNLSIQRLQDELDSLYKNL